MQAGSPSFHTWTVKPTEYTWFVGRAETNERDRPERRARYCSLTSSLTLGKLADDERPRDSPAFDNSYRRRKLLARSTADRRRHLAGLSYQAAPVTVAGDRGWEGYRPHLIARLASEQALDAYDVPADPMDTLYRESRQ